MRWKLVGALLGACLFCTSFGAIEPPQGFSRNKHHGQSFLNLDFNNWSLEFRQYTCLQPEELEAAECRLAFMSADEEPTTITENGCFIVGFSYSTNSIKIFQEKSGNLIRNYCPLQCHDADYAYVLAQRPDVSKKACILDKSFGIVRRRKDWFLWRSLSCSLAEVGS